MNTQLDPEQVLNIFQKDVNVINLLINFYYD